MGLGKRRFYSNVNVANRLIGCNALITLDIVSLCPELPLITLDIVSLCPELPLITLDIVSLCPELPLPNQVSHNCLFCTSCRPQ